MHKEIGRNDPCPCGSGKKYKKCCELRLGKRKFSATILSSGERQPSKAANIYKNLFSKMPPSEATKEEPHHPPEADKPM
jgi:hypothetical protein